jgi:murein DD-endopeptidase MepM/ murein hydrolase activator NlpD
MKIRNLLSRAADRARNWHPQITRTRVILFAITLVAVGLMLGALEPPAPGADLTYTHAYDLDLPVRDSFLAPPGAAGETAGVQVPLPGTEWDLVEVRAGQTLDAIFREQEFSIGLLHEILALNGDTGNLTRIKPGDEFAFQRHTDGSLKRMRYPIDESSYLLVENNGDELRADRLERQVYSEVHQAEGIIESSLFLAGKRAGLKDGMIMQLANIFGWDVDFVLDIRAGDRFYLVYEKVYREGEFLRDGDILAATFINQGQRFQAIRYAIEGNGRYFAPDGRPMRKAFLRAPLNFSYISSNFNPRRFHPILKRVKAHNGIDYRAPTGTPVYAAGEGKVIRSAYSKYNGHHVYIQHANSIVTRYLHFTKRTVKQGDRVKQGKVIGYVGATGLATAPHLHYEFLVNGVHRNPRTVPLPKVVPLEGPLLTDFQAHAAPFQNQLSRLESASLYASRE